MKRALLSVGLFCLLSLAAAKDANAQFFSIHSFQGRYLQAYTDGTTHASNDKRHNEETWRIIPTSNGRYALRNARTSKYLSVQDGNCIRTNRDTVTEWEEFYIEPVSDPNGLTHYFRFRSARQDYQGYLGTNDAGDDYQDCGGEVHYFIDHEARDRVATANTRGRDRVRTHWEIYKESDDGGSGTSIDIGTLLKTAAELAAALASL